MRKKIKSSIFAKMFLSIGAILIITSLLIYGIVMFVTPQSYKAEANRNFSKNAEQLAEALQKAARDEAEKIITAFCLENNATVSLQGEGESLTFGKIDVLQKGSTENVGATQTVSSVIRFIDSDTPYSLMMAQGMKGVNEMAAVFKRLLPWIFLLIVLISIIGSFLCSRILARPVLQISRISKRMSELDMTWHCDVNRTDELGVLAKSLNTMAEKLNGTMSELEGANYQLQEDIKKEKEQERQRRTFFAAVSHELKTPITILKGQVESMIYGIGDYKNKEKYLPLTLETIERMENLVKEILTVSRLTSDDFRLVKQSVNIRLSVCELIDVYAPLAQKKNIRLDSSALCDVVIQVDRKLFEKVISNVLNNAIKYSPDGAEVKVELTVEALLIENTGVHIPEDYQENLFAPLTRVEASRNTHTGGSGLGLYIVKTILDLHGLSCTIQNSAHGVCFTVYFK